IFSVMMANIVDVGKCDKKGYDLAELSIPTCRGKSNGNYCYPFHSNKIIQCSGGTMFVLNCQSGLEYNCRLDRCEYRGTRGNCRGPAMKQCRFDRNCRA
ncbi:hypothetical protein B4U80_12456, partial [Leptotrombidium deliense]